MGTEDMGIVSALGVGADLDAEFRRMPGLLWHWGNLEATAIEMQLQAKADMEQKHAEVYKRLRADKSEKLTESGLEAGIETDPEYSRYRVKYIQAEGNAKRMRAAVLALMSKSRMLEQLGNNSISQQRAGISDSSKRRAG